MSLTPTDQHHTWTHADNWFRRELGDGTYMIVSQRLKEIRQNGAVYMPWFWRRHQLGNGQQLASGPSPYLAQFGHAAEAMRAADQNAKAPLVPMNVVVTKPDRDVVDKAATALDALLVSTGRQTSGVGT